VMYDLAAIPMTLSDLQGHTSNAGVLKCDFSHSCTAVDKISPDACVEQSLCVESVIAEPLATEASGKPILPEMLHPSTSNACFHQCDLILSDKEQCAIC